MKINTAETLVEKSGVLQENSFSIKGSAQAFQILSSTLYSDKKAAIVRELSCNGFDSHIQAGKRHIPIDVHLPNRLEPWFAVKDYGTGLDHQDVMVLYSTYFESTKNQSNDFTGAFGLGSKSPFSYTDQFTVVSIYNGIKNTYAAYISKDGTPNISLLHSDNTNDCNGVEVRVPVKESDFNNFSDAVREQLLHFNPLPKLNRDSFDWGISTPIFEGKGWKYYDNKNPSGSYRNFDVTIIQGNVAYKLADTFESFLTDEQRDETYQFCRRIDVDIEFPIGSLEVSASRESLGYTKQTSLAIYERLVQVKEEVRQKFLDMIDAIPNDSLWNKWVQVAELQKKNLNAFNILNIPYKHDFKLQLKGSYPDLAITLKTLKGSKRYKDDKNISALNMETLMVSPSTQRIFFIKDCDVPSGWISHYVMTNHFPVGASKYDERQLFVITLNGNNFKQISDDLGNPTFIKFSSLTRPPTISKGPAIKRTLGYLDLKSNNLCSFQQNDIMPTSGFYIPYNKKTYFGFKSKTDFQIAVSCACDIKWIDDKATKIILLNNKQIKKIKDDTGWIDITEFLKEKITKFFDSEEGDKYLNSKQLDKLHISQDSRKYLKGVLANPDFDKIKKTDMGKYLIKCGEVLNQVYNKYYSFDRILDTTQSKPPKSETAIDFITEQKELIEKYPMTSPVFKGLYGIEDYVKYKDFIDYIRLVNKQK